VTSRQSPLVRAQILEAASRLLVEKGNEDAVSIRAVAEAVGVTPPSIYLHFTAKLIFAICEEYFDRETVEAARGSDDAIESLILLAARTSGPGSRTWSGIA